jgi:dolichol-phosphate mannosyltransferase
MIKTWKNDSEVEVVYTTRTRRHGEHWLKLLLTKFGYRIINKISEIEIYVDSGDFKLLSRKVVNHILSLNEDTPYLRGLISWVGYKQAQVKYEREPRYDGRENTKNRMISFKVMRNFLDRALISYTDAPLKLTLFFGFFISFISFLFILFIFIQKFIGNSIPGWTAIMSGIFLFGGIQITILGFIGLYVGSIFRAVKKRPLYLIKEIIRK